jgi:hypothetical protein
MDGHNLLSPLGGWPKPGVSSKKRIRQNAQKKYFKILQKAEQWHLGDGAGRGTSIAK